MDVLKCSVVCFPNLAVVTGLVLTRCFVEAVCMCVV